MNNNSTNYFQEKLETLPNHLRWAIRDVDYMKELSDIKKKHKLHIDQAATLEQITQRLILGDIDAPTFMNTMFKEAYVSSQVAADILVDIDVMILKRIREKIESFEQEEQEVQRHRDEYKTEEEREIDTMNAVYRQQDEEYIKIKKDVEEELSNEGFLEDGSNITDEDIAKAYGMTVAEYLAQNKNGAIKTARATEEINEKTTPDDILSEKEDLLKELESPEKSFVKPLFTAKPVEVKKVEIPPIAPDHQLQNTHVEEPIHTEIYLPSEVVEPVASAPIPTTPTVAPIKPVDVAPVIKKPAKIDLSHDIYREPIE